MKKLVISLIILSIIIVSGFVLRSDTPPNPVEPVIVEQEPVPYVSIYPPIIYPGDPVFITIHASSSPVSVLFGKKTIKTFSYNGKTHALTAIDFTEKIPVFDVVVTFEQGNVATTSVVITPREKIEKTFGIPEKLGGNTSEASKILIQNLAAENSSLANTQTASTTLWTQNFVYPLATFFITDNYGYDRNTVGQNIVHKGTDLRASIGTEVFAMNSGIVEIATKYTVYGNTVVIDHGLGVQTMYMHLSELQVKKGDKVEKGDVIGLSGDTGYADAAHLHISVRIAGISIDPMTFLKFFMVSL